MASIGGLGKAAAIMIVLATLAYATPPRADDNRPPPHLGREIDRLERSGADDPLLRRRLGDELRRTQPDLGNSERRRQLERLDRPALPPSPPPGPAAAPRPSLPSSTGGRGLF